MRQHAPLALYCLLSGCLAMAAGALSSMLASETASRIAVWVSVTAVTAILAGAVWDPASRLIQSGSARSHERATGQRKDQLC